jgi:LytS/YehU family sensor histidine kinase
MNFFTLNEQGTLTYANVNDPRHRVSLQVGANLWGAATSPRFRALRGAVAGAMDSRQPRELETFDDTDNTWWLQRIYPMADGVAVYCEDVTLHKAAESVLTEAQHRLQAHAQQLSAARQEIRYLQRAVLRGAMDNHFIFSSLSAIQHFVVTNDRQSAVQYLSSFAKLMRGVLDSTRQSDVPLTEELALVKRYVGLEQLRFGNLFDFILEAGEDIDDSLRVPPMILQPFVENAIVHGLAGKASRGQLLLQVRKGDGKVLIRIEDDGIGRAAAASLRSKKSPEHKPASMVITEDRIALLDDVSVRVIDKMQGDMPAGTVVLLEIVYPTI